VSSAPATAAGWVSPDRLTLLAFAGVVILGAFNAIAVKVSVGDLAPIWSAGFRFLLAGLLLVGIVIGTRRQFPRGRSLGGAALYGAVAFSGSFAFIYTALREVPASLATVFLALVPLLTFGLAILHGQEGFRLQGLLGALIALSGVALVVADHLRADVPVLPILLILAGVTFIAEGAVILKWVPRSDPFATNAVAMLVGAGILLSLSQLTGEAWTLPALAETWAALGYLVVLGSIVLFGLYLFALHRWTASAVSYTTLLMPLVTLPLAALLLGEVVSLLFLVGAAIALVGVYVGAFMHFRPRRTSATSLPECLPVDASAPPEPTRASAAPRGAS
jgi:drug/metabolite transporter (DMT)-like permease